MTPPPPSIQTIAFLYPGSMGASLASALHAAQPSLELLTHLSSRSEATRRRAASAGLVDVPLPELVARSDLIVSVLPPSEALELARTIVRHLPDSTTSSSSVAVVCNETKLERSRPIYVDANAISPGTVAEISALLRPHGVPFIDGSIIGGPAKEGYLPKLYLSSAPRWSDELKLVAQRLGDGLKVHVLGHQVGGPGGEGEGEGAASALKMCYGGMTKGTTALATMLIMAAQAHSPATADALLHELSESQGARLQGLTKSIPGMIPKAYRWVGEMEEISQFIASSLEQSHSGDTHTTVADTYRGIARIYQRIADNLDQTKGEADGNGNGNGNGTEVAALLEWTEKAQELSKNSDK